MQQHLLALLPCLQATCTRRLLAYGLRWADFQVCLFGALGLAACWQLAHLCVDNWVVAQAPAVPTRFTQHYSKLLRACCQQVYLLHTMHQGKEAPKQLLRQRNHVCIVSLGSVCPC